MNRRDFLKTAGLAGAACAVPATAITACNEVNKNVNIFNINRLGKGSLKLSYEPYELKLRHTFTVASYSRTTTPDVQLRLEYDGFTGYGEPGDTAAKAAIDIALHDLVGNMMGQPLYRIFGLNPEKAPATSFTIGIDSPEVVREKTLEALGKYRILKVKVGLDSDREMIETIRSVTDLPLVVDANQGWKDREKALDMLFWLHGQGVQMAEQPMPKERLDDIAWLSERSPIPIFADESIQRLSDVKRISGAFNGINIKLMKCTGLNEARKMIAYARAEGMKVMMGCMTETSCAVSAAAQLSPAVDFADLDGNLLISNDPFEGVLVENGMLRLSGRPGLGLRRIR